MLIKTDLFLYIFIKGSVEKAPLKKISVYEIIFYGLYHAPNYFVYWKLGREYLPT